MIRILLLFWLGLISLSALSQTVIQASVRDKETKEPLSYCGIRIKDSGKSCISNEDGVFRLTVNPDKDSIMVSFLGYKTRTIAAKWFVTHAVVYLEKNGIVFEEVVVHAGDDYLFDIMGKCRQKILSLPPDQSKMYFSLETTYDNQIVEMLESYNNCKVNAYGMDEMQIKNGRIGLAVTNDSTYFVSLNTSGAISYINLCESNAYMPDIPFQFKNSRMKKLFALNIVAGGDAETHLYHIGFNPRNNTGTGFSGEVWIDKTSFAIEKLILKGENFSTHPFLPKFSGSAVEAVGMDIELKYADKSEGNQLIHIRFNYTLTFKKGDISRAVHTKGLMYFYDYNDPFILPNFDFDPSQSDYRKITFLPYNASFWNSANGLLHTDKQNEILSFLQKNGMLFNYSQKLNNEIPVNTFSKIRKRFFEDNYVWWSDTNRLSLKKDRLLKDSLAATDINKLKLRADLSRLSVQIFLDINTSGDSLIWLSATVFDVYKSFYNLPENVTSNCYLNIWFDLCEMERRKMEQNLLRLSRPDKKSIDLVYQQTLSTIESMYDLYRKKTQTGFIQKELRKYNDLVFKETGIDNFKIFRIDETPANP